MTTLDGVVRFWEWYDRARGDTSTREVERQAGVKYGMIGNAYKKRVTFEVAISVAQGLGLPEDVVLREAGLLPPAPEGEREPTLRELYEVAKRLSYEQRVAVLEFAWFEYRRERERERGNKAASDERGSET